MSPSDGEQEEAAALAVRQAAVFKQAAELADPHSQRVPATEFRCFARTAD